MIQVMSPGPTNISETVRAAMAAPATNPDLDFRFLETYQQTCTNIQQIFGTANDVHILCGEGMLGLDAACVSLIEKGDRVLVIENGLFGKGFADLVALYGGESVLFSSDQQLPIDVQRLEQFLQQDHDFKAATIVHCETPTGIINPIDQICPLLKNYGILTIVDTVSAAGGEDIQVDRWQIDIALCASQKCFSAPVGLTMLSISQPAWDTMEQRATPIPSFYGNLLLWKDCLKKKAFPYTHAVQLVKALLTATELMLSDPQRLERHQKIAEAVRKTFTQCGFSVYAKAGFSSTVTAVCMPATFPYDTLFQDLLTKYEIIIGGGLPPLEGKIFRIGHMGENCQVDKIYHTLHALDIVFEENKVPLPQQLSNTFLKVWDTYRL